MNVSLDGYVEDPDGGIDFPIIDAELHRYYNDLERSFDVELYGRRMWKTMSSYWPTGDADPSVPEHEAEFARLWRALPKVVFSSTLAESEIGWNARLVKSDAVAEVRRLKSEPGDLMGVGGATLAGSLVRAGLVDEVILMVHPVALGGGKPFFPHGAPRHNLRLVEQRTFNSGVVVLRYQTT